MSSDLLYTGGKTIPSWKQLWVEGAVPLIIDKFVVYLYICPISTILLDTMQPDTNPYFGWIFASILMMVFLINVAVFTYEDYYHIMGNIRESPMFRSVYVCLCTAIVARRLGKNVICFTITTFLPVIYVRVSALLPECIAGYSIVFYILTALNSVNFPPQVVANTTPEVAGGFLQSGISWVLLFIGTVYHAVWSSSHRHTSDRSIRPLFSYFFIRLRNSPLPISLSRTIMTMICILVRNTYQGRLDINQNSYGVLAYFLQTLFLLLTISTFLAWTHCLHVYHNSLSSVLAAAVVTAACGILVETVAQALCLSVLCSIAVWIDVAQFRKRDRNTKSD